MTERETSTSDSAASNDRTVDVHYLKSPSFREVACDGALGGSTPAGKLWLAFYGERFPLPRVVRHGLSIDENSGDRVLDPVGETLESKRGVIRSVEFGVYMNTETAIELHTWLGEYLEEIRGGKNE